MSEVGRTCMWTVRPVPAFGAWCGDPGVAVRKVAAMRLGEREVLGYDLTLCAAHRDAYDQGVLPDGTDG